MDQIEEVVEALKREHGRNVADIVVTLNDRTWRRAWAFGFACGVGAVVAVYGLLEWFGWL